MAYRGLSYRLPFGVSGLIGYDLQPNLDPSRLIDADNIMLRNGFFEKIEGATKYNSSALESGAEVLGVHDWMPTVGTQRMIVWVNGKILRDTGDGSFGTTMKSSLTTPGDRPTFCEGGAEATGNNRKLFIFSGSNAVQVVDGDATTTANLSTPPADWSGSAQPAGGVVHQNRLWGWGTSADPHRVYFSLQTDHEDFTSAGTGSIPVYSGVGEKIASCISYKGLLIVFKYPRGVFAINADMDVETWTVDKVNLDIGCAGPACVVQVDDDVMFIEPGGEINAVSGIDQYGNLGSKSVTSETLLNPWIHREINRGALGGAICLFNSDTREAAFCVPRTGASDPNMRLTADFSLNQLRWLPAKRDEIRGFGLYINTSGVEQFMWGDDAGFVWIGGQDSRTKGGAYTAYGQTPHMDFGFLDPALATKEKTAQFLEVVAKTQGNWTVTAEIYWDNVFIHSVTFNMGTVGVTLGSFTLGDDALGQSSLVNRREKIYGSGRRLSIILKNSGDEQNFQISDVYVSFKVNAESEGT